MVLLDEHIVTTQALAAGFLCHGASMVHLCQAMMFSTFKGPFEEDINECAQLALSSKCNSHQFAKSGGTHGSCVYPRP
jgi:hypothetical protein